VKKKTPPYAILGAVALGILAIVFFYHWKSTQDQAAADAVAKAKADLQAQIDDLKAQKQVTVTPTDTNVRNVLYATQPVEPGVKISSAFFEKKLTPTDILPDAYTDQSDIVGFYAIRKIEKGDPLTPRNIGKSLPYMSQRITPGMRALSLNVFNAEYNDTGGFVVDGDRVDLLYSVNTVTGDFKVNTQTVMQNVQVLYVPGSQIKTDKTDGINAIPTPGEQIAVTFEVTPEQAQALVFMSNVKNAKFSMILRSRRDSTELKIKPFDVRDYDLSNLKKVQKTVDKSIDRVNELTKEIEDEEKKQSPQGTTNETPTPTPPSP
jgi:Flp pilus assembly protein CpaB